MSGLSCVTFRGAQHKGCLATPQSPPGRSAFCRRRGANRLVDPSALLELTLAPFPPLSPRPCQSIPVELDRAATGAWLRDPEAPPPPKARHRADIPEPTRAEVLSTSGGRTSARQGCTSAPLASGRRGSPFGRASQRSCILCCRPPLQLTLCPPRPLATAPGVLVVWFLLLLLAETAYADCNPALDAPANGFISCSDNVSGVAFVCSKTWLTSQPASLITNCVVSLLLL
jgi:hypothetical protein